MVRSILKFLINLALLAGVIWLICRFTTLDEKLISRIQSRPTASQQGGSPDGACVTPWGVTIPDGGTVFAYENERTGDGSCQEEIRVCQKGVLQGSYEYPSCNGMTPTMGVIGTGVLSTGSVIAEHGASCTTPWGQTIQHGNYIVSYESPSSCRFQRRMCVDGQLLGKFLYNYCIIPYGNDSNLAGNQGVPQYDSIYSVDNAQTFSNTINDESPYKNGRNYGVSYGGTNANAQLPNDYWNQNTNGNVAVIKTWNDTKRNPLGTNGTSEYTKPKSRDYTNYDLTQKGCNTPWGTFVDNGQYVIAYKTANAPKGGSCEYERRTCSYGTLHGTFTYPSCGGQTSTTRQYGNQGYDQYYRNNTTPQVNNQKSCRTPWGTTVQHGDYIRAYKYASAPWSDGCEGEIRYCHNGVLDGSYGNASCRLTEPTSQGCYGRQCGTWNNSCSLPRGGSISHGQSVVAYAYINGSCNSERRTCSNGWLQGSYTLQSCYTQPSYQSCSLPRGGSIAHGQSVVAYTKIDGACYSERRTCSDGWLQGSYTMSSCTSTPTYQSCSLPRGGTIAHGQSVEAFSSTTSPCYKEIRRCYNGSLNGSYQYSYCNLPNGGSDPVTDTYGAWQSVGYLDQMPNSQDTCHGNASAEFTCQPGDVKTCVDYRKVQDDCCVAGRAKYEKRNVTCVR